MARIPRALTRKSFTSVPRAAESSAGSVYANIAQALEQTASVLQPLAEQDAAAKGLAAVTRDENGNLQANTKIPFTALDQKYNLAASAVYMAELDGDYEVELAGLRQQYAGDVAGFNKAADDLARNIVGNAPEAFKGDVQLMTIRKNGRVSRQEAATTRKVTEARAANSINARIASGKERIDQLLADPTPENVALANEEIAEMGSLYKVKEQLPGSTFTPENSTYELERIQNNVASAYQGAIDDRVEGAVDIFQDGEVPSDIADLAELTAGTEAGERLEVYRAAHNELPNFASQSPEEQLAEITRRKEAGVDEDGLTVLKVLEQQHERTLKSIAEDPIEYGAKQLSVSPLNPSSQASVNRRLREAQELTDQGRNPLRSILSKEEAANYKSRLSSDDPEETMGAITDLARFGPAGQRIADEMGAKPVERHALGLAQANADPAIMADIVLGSKVKGANKPDNDYKAEVVQQVLGGAIDAQQFSNVAGQGAFIQSTVAAAEAIFAQRTIDADPSDAEEIWAESLKSAMGTSGRVGGVQEINGHTAVIPPDMDSQLVNNAFNNFSRAYSGRTTSALETGEVDPLDLTDPNFDRQDEVNGRLSDAQLDIQARDFWKSSTLSGGFPKGLEGSEINPGDVRMVAISSERYILQYDVGGLIGASTWITMRDSETRGRFEFNIREFAKRGL